jgi:hypothetical protein
MTTLLILLSVVLGVLKLAGIVHLSWLLVSVPALIALGIFVVSLIVIAILWVATERAVAKGLNW